MSPTTVACIGITNRDGVLVELMEAKPTARETGRAILEACARLDAEEPWGHPHGGRVGTWVVPDHE